MGWEAAIAMKKTGRVVPLTKSRTLTLVSSLAVGAVVPAHVRLMVTCKGIALTSRGTCTCLRAAPGFGMASCPPMTMTGQLEGKNDLSQFLKPLLNGGM